MPKLALLLSIALLAAWACGASAAEWGCFGTKPGHPTPEERLAFIREVSELAIKAEATHGVPAGALAALAVVESGYGWTRLALEANNLFAWKATARGADGRKFFVAECLKRPGAKNRFVHFASRADAFDYVSAKLASLDAYREHTRAYQSARKSGAPPEAAAKAWIAGIARRYSRSPAEFTRKLTRIMNDPTTPADTPSPEHNLYRLSAVPAASR
jgi:flagellum-specific peptidoglycan hydrolase FlgJ